MHKKRRFGVLAAAVLGALSSYNSAKAITFTWQGPGDDSANPSSGNWASPSFWGGGELPFVPDQSEYYTNRASTELVFGGGNQNRAYTSWDDYNVEPGLAGELNILRFNSTSTAVNTLTSVRPSTGFDFGTTLKFVANGTTTPRITQDSSGSFDVDIPLEFSTPAMNFTGGGTGRINLLRAITGTGTLDIQGGNTWITGGAQIQTQSGINFGNAGGGGSLTLDHSSGLGAVDRLKDTINMTFGVGGGTLAFVGATGGSSETVGNITVSAGANRLQATSAGGATATLNTGTFNRTGGVMDFVGVGGTLGASATGPRIVVANPFTNVNGIIGGWATANGVDFATYGPNGVTAYTGGYTPLPQNNFDPNTNYQAASSINLTGGGNIFTVRLNTAVAQTIDLGANNVNVTGGILKIGAGTTTINGTGNLGGGSGGAELVLHVNQGALTFNAPFAATKWTKAGTGALNLTLAASPVWSTASFSGPVTLNVTADSTVSGQLAGSGSLVKNGTGKLTLTSSSNGFSGGATINGGMVELLSTGASSTSVNINSTTSYFGSGGSININNGSTLKLTTRAGGTINVGRSVVFNAGGGLLDLTNTAGGVIASGSTIPLTTANGATNAAVIRFNGGDRGFSTNPNPLQEAWSSNDNLVRFSSLNGTGPVRVELSKAGSVRQGNGGGQTQSIPMAFTIAGPVTSGPVAGFSDSGPSGTINPASNTNTGRIFTDNANVVNYTQGLTLQGALQMSVQGASRAVAGNITVAGAASGNPAFVSFNGRGTGQGLAAAIQQPGQNTGTNGQHPLWLNYNGTNAAGTLRIQEGAIASMDLRIRVEQNNSSGVFMEGPTVIESGGTLRFTQSWGGPNGATQTNVGYDRVNNTITGQGATTKESAVDIFLPDADTTSGSARLNGVQFNGTNVAVIVNGTGLGGLRVNGLNRPAALLAGGADVAADLKVGNLLTQARLAGLTGTGGFLTPAAQGTTFTLPAASEWTTGAAAANVGLRAANSNLTGVDVALPANSTWSHNLHVDAGAELGVNGVNVNAGTTSGLGALGAGAGGVRFNTGTVVAPGAAGVAGVLSVNGSATLAAGSTLRAEITGATNGTLRATDSLTITGSTLQFVPTNVTAGAHRWDVAVADGDANSVGSIVGKFGSAPLPADETTGSQRLWSLVYEPTRVSVGFTVGGDADYSGNTNFDDLLALAKHYNATGAQWIDGDFTRDGTVNFDDLLVLAKNYNRVAAGAVPDAVPGATADFNAAVASAFAAPVPEPTTLGLFGIGLLGMVGGRRRRRA
jgi:fibronectin-binding autotransporter adhesin